MMDYKEYLLFLDETQPTRYNPYFCLAGLIINRSIYEDILIPRINTLKQTFFNRNDIVFHYTEMKNNKGDYQCLSDSKTRLAFWTEYNNILSETDFNVVGIYFEHSLMKKSFISQSNGNYNIAFYHILDSYMHFLSHNYGYGHICIESRTFKQNQYLNNAFFNYVNNGSYFYNSDKCKNNLSAMGFLTKLDNCIGLQIADIIPVRLMRVVNNFKDYYNIGHTLCNKIYQRSTPLENVVGLRRLL